MILILFLVIGFIGALLFRLAINPAGTLLGLVQVATFFGAVGAGLIYFYGGPAIGDVSYLLATIFLGLTWVLITIGRSRASY